MKTFTKEELEQILTTFLAHEEVKITQALEQLVEVPLIALIQTLPNQLLREILEEGDSESTLADTLLMIGIYSTIGTLRGLKARLEEERLN